MSKVDGDYCRVEGCDKLRAKVPTGRRTLCGGHYNRLSKFGDVQAHIPLRAQVRTESDFCVVPDCGRPRKVVADGRDSLCGTHRSRKNRTGNVSADTPVRQVAPAGTGQISSSGYWVDYLPSHPIAMADGRVRRHRAVLYDAIGAGAHPCHWCSKEVEWDTPFPQGLVTDHLDADIFNNDISNLVPSCQSCNVTRRNYGNPMNWVREAS